MNTKEKIEVMQAWIDKKPVEMKARSEKLWSRVNFFEPNWNWDVNEYRIVPKPSTRPMKMEDFPNICWIRNPKLVGVHLINVLYEDTVCAGKINISYQSLYENGWEYSEDRINWKPCCIDDNPPF